MSKVRQVREDPVLARATAVAFHALEESAGAVEALDPHRRAVVLVSTAQGLIDNGGFAYFFEANFPGRPPYDVFVQAYLAVGSRRCARLLSDAIAVLAIPAPERSASRRARFLANSATAREALEALSGEVCGNPSPWVQLGKYVRSHTASFRRSAKARRRSSAAA